MSTSPRHRRGFTLLEMVLALVLVGLLAVVVVPRFEGLGDAGVNQQAEQLRRDISRVQLLAMGQAQRLRLSVSTSGYSVSCVAPASCLGQAVADPATKLPFAETLEPGTAFEAALNLDFDSLGRPVDATGLLKAPTDFTMTRGAHRARVVVLPLTGFASVLD